MEGKWAKSPRDCNASGIRCFPSAFPFRQALSHHLHVIKRHLMRGHWDGDGWGVFVKHTISICPIPELTHSHFPLPRSIKIKSAAFPPFSDSFSLEYPRLLVFVQGICLKDLRCPLLECRIFQKGLEGKTEERGASRKTDRFCKTKF